MNGKPDICIYHGGCLDGFGAAWVVRKAFGDGVKFYPAIHGKEPPNVAGKDVVIVDFSYKSEVLESMLRSGDPDQAMSILIIDHHKTALSDLIDVRTPEGKYEPLLWRRKWESCGEWPVRALFDMDRSGAQLAWDYFFEGVDRPMMIDYIGDIDLWKFKFGVFTRRFAAALGSYPMDFKVWDEIASDPRRLIAEGEPILRAFEANLNEFLKESYIDDVGGFKVPVVNVPYRYASHAANALLKKYPDAPFAASWFRRADGFIQWSLRSEDDRQDVSVVARSLGGGGHRNAAGFQQ